MLDRKENPKSIDFLQPVGKSEKVVEASFSWLTTIGKSLLMIVHVVVLGAFGYRLVTDGQNNDLTAEINAQVNILENDTWKKSAIKYENLQNLIEDIKIVKEEQELNSKLISEVLDGIPTTLNVENISITNKRVSITLTTSDFTALKNYEESLKNNGDYYSEVNFNIQKTGDELEVSISFQVIGEVV
jgi:hypothetical protein